MLIQKKKKNRYHFRSRGVPTNILGDGRFEDNSSDSADDKLNQSSEQSNENGIENQIIGQLDEQYFPAGTGETSNENTNNNSMDKNQCLIDNNCDNSSVHDKANSSKNEIPPPPGAPKTENTARLRRYRLNLE